MCANKLQHIRTWLQFISLATCLVSLCSLLDQHHRYFELLSHFKILYLVASLICGCLLVIAKNYKLSALLFITASIHAFAIAPWYYRPWHFSQATPSTLQQPTAQSTTQPTTPQKTNIKILHANLLSSNQEFHLVAKLIKKERPDLLVLQELTPTWLNALTPTLAQYPYRLERPQVNNFGIAIYSKIPLTTAEAVQLTQLPLPSLEVSFALGQQKVILLTTHPVPPINADYYQARNQQLQAVAQRLAKQTGAKILVGDLNSSMWSSDYQQLETVSGLKNARLGFGVLPTWPAHLPTLLPFVGIPLDHILLSEPFSVKNIKLGDDIGSDHLPLIVELAMATN